MTDWEDPIKQTMISFRCQACSSKNLFPTTHVYQPTVLEAKLHRVKQVLGQFEGMLGCDYLGDDLLYEIRILREELEDD